MQLPQPFGPVTRLVVETLRGSTGTRTPVVDGPVLGNRDAQLGLWLLYELSYRGIEGVDPALEWDPDVVRIRVVLEQRFEHELREATRESVSQALESGDDVGTMLLAMPQAHSDGPSLAAYLRREASREQLVDFLRERSVQQLKESDPQAFLLPRLTGRAKVAMAELQYDEFGAGRPERLHQTLYAEALVAAGLDPTYGAYLTEVSALSLASANVMSLLALNRRLLAAGVGHFAAFEASSSVPSRRISAGLERVGLAEASPYFDEHVEADAVHEQIAAREVCGALVEDDPDSLDDIVFGAAACLLLDRLSGEELLERWSSQAPAEVAS